MNKTVKASPHVAPTTTEAVKLFEENGGQLTAWPEFGIDPLSCEESLSSARSQHFHSHNSDFIDMFHGVVNGNPALFQNTIQLFSVLTHEYCS